MKTKLSQKFLSILLVALMLLPTVAGIIPVFAVEETTYVLNSDSLKEVSANSKTVGDTDTAGTANFFTIHYSDTAKIDGSSKTFDDGFTVSQRINFGGKLDISDVPKNCISFITQASATVKIWWVCGDAGREFGIYNESAELVAQTSDNKAKNDLCVSELTIPSAGKYYLGGITGNNYIFKIAVTTKTLDLGPRAEWSTVTSPVISEITVTEDGMVKTTIDALVGHNGADKLVVNMYEGDTVISTATSTSAKSTHSLSFSPVKSGTYSFEAVMSRDGETDKASEHTSCDYTLPLTAPYITNIANLGNKTINVIWNPVREAESYNVYVDGELYQSTTQRSCVIAGLTSGATATVSVEALRGSDVSEKGEASIKVGAKNIAWNYTIYGPSAKTGSNSYLENKDGSVIVSSLNGSGKLQPTGADGLGFYYTAIPTTQNFTFRATAVVNNWTFSNGQEGFGLMVTDHVPSSDYTSNDFWTNQYMAACTKIEYWYSTDEEGNYYFSTSDEKIGTKYSMKLGIGAISKIGIDQSIIDRTALGETGLIVGQNGYLKSVVHTLERKAGFFNKEAGTYNIIGNWKNTEGVEGSFPEEELITEMTLEIQKNNTGYFITYYDKDGNVVRTIKNYEPEALNKFDSEYVYVGMFAARNANITFKDIELTTIDPKDDAPAEERPIDIIVPTVTITSATSTTSTDYNLIADVNLNGTLEISLNDNVIVSKIPVNAYERFSKLIDISSIATYDEPNTLVIRFTPDPDQELPPYTELSSTNAVTSVIEINLYKGNYHRKNIYVSPDGMYYNTGSKEHPYDIYTAIQRVVPGQTIILMEGTYKLKTGLTIQRGVDGTEENPIRMIADPEAKTRPIIDFMGEGTGILHGGNWWHFYGFDVTNSLDGQKGFQVSGNNNILEQIHTYHNGNTGIQISRYSGVDLTIEHWPANNLILNCTSWGNADTGYEDADGFAAKLTIGEGNVFDGCVAYNNADDGWDLYAKVATGEIGAVVIKNCVAYGNGYLEDGTNAGNGNGFKMGGDSLPGQHQLINCIAFNNKAKGIDSNSCPDIIVKNCISYNNGSHNVALYTNTANNTSFVADGIISIKDDKVSEDAFNTNESFKPKGNQDTDAYTGSSNYYWMGKICSNTAGEQLTTDIFVTTEFTGITRNEDGTINMNGFLELNDKAPTNAGTTGDSTPSNVIELIADEEHNYSDEWTHNDYYVHWKECECGDKHMIGEHEFVTIIDKPATETEAGRQHSECTVCGYKMPAQQIPALGNEKAPNIFEDFGGWLAWLFQMIADFFASLFGGKS